MRGMRGMIRGDTISRFVDILLNNFEILNCCWIFEQHNLTTETLTTENLRSVTQFTDTEIVFESHLIVIIFVSVRYCNECSSSMLSALVAQCNESMLAAHPFMVLCTRSTWRKSLAKAGLDPT